MSENFYFHGGNYTLDTADDRYVGSLLGSETPEVPTGIWKANTEYVIGEVVYSHANTEPKALAFKFTAVASGSSPYTSGSVEPIWPENLGESIVDNEITWTVVSTIYEHLLPSSVPAIIELFELELENNIHTNEEPSVSPTYYDGTTGGYPSVPDTSVTYRFHDGASANNNGDVYFNGRKYMRLPIQASGFELKGGQNQTLPRPSLTVSNLFGLITSIIASANTFNQATGTNDLLGAKLTRIKTLDKFVDASNFESDTPVGSEDNSAEIVDSEGTNIVPENNPNPYGTPDYNIRFPDEIYFINRKTNEDRNSVEFELVAPFDLPNMQIPKEVCLPEQFPAVGTFK